MPSANVSVVVHLIGPRASLEGSQVLGAFILFLDHLPGAFPQEFNRWKHELNFLGDNAPDLIWLLQVLFYFVHCAANFEEFSPTTIIWAKIIFFASSLNYFSEVC